MNRVNPNTIQDKLLVGYQGWFTCAGDGEPIGPGHHGWLHWFHNPLPAGGRPNTDLWPDTSAYTPSELYLAPGLTTPTGGPVHLFSSRHPQTVRRHFRWMAEHGVDGAFLQRFAGQCEKSKSGSFGVRGLRDEVGERVREAAEQEGRVFAIMYDVSGVPPDKIQGVLEQDWAHLLVDQRVLESPSYLREHGRPVVALWGFGFNDRKHTPDLVRGITQFFRHTPGGVYLVAGVPGHWRTSTSDADRDPGFVTMWTDCFDAICPWTVGRYGNEEAADRWGEERVKADADYLRKLAEEGGRRVDYIPVVLPGGSGFNLSQGKWGMNDIPRNGGRFLWRQLYNARRAGVRTIYGAMWDEYDEGTALMPVVSYASQLPVHPSYRFIALDVDGYNLPPDWYMRIVGLAAEALHGGRALEPTLPLEALRDYWRTRPRGDGGVADVTRAVGAWRMSGEVPSDAPPPYSLTDAYGPPPPVRHDARPVPPPVSLSPGRMPSGVGAVAAAGQAVSPPPVDLSTRPSTRGYPSMPPPVPHRPSVSGGGVAPSSVGYDGRPGAGMPPVPGEYTRGRSRSRSPARKHKHKQKQKQKQKQGRRSSSSSSSSSSGRMVGPSHPPGSSQMGFPAPAPAGLYHAHSEGGYGRGRGGYEPVRHGSYTPVHSAPYPGPVEGGAGPSQPGYTPHPSYVPGTGAPYTGPVHAGGSGKGGIQGGIASALQMVEGIAGKQTRRQLEKTVQTLSNSKSTLMNKLK